MGKIERIQQQVQALTPDEFASFREWFLVFESDAWDRQIERDAVAGKLDAMAQRALKEHSEGKTRPL